MAFLYLTPVFNGVIGVHEETPQKRETPPKRNGGISSAKMVAGLRRRGILYREGNWF